MEKTLFVNDVTALLSETHVLFTTTSKQCAKIQLLLHILATHHFFITRRGGVLLHETIYNKMMQFYDHIIVQSQKTPPQCACSRNNPQKTKYHNLLQYATCFRTAIPLYKQLYEDYKPVYTHLVAKLNENVTHLIFSYVTSVPAYH